VRCIGLTHDFRNHLADGVRTGSDGGLTDLGREALREMGRLGIVADVSHLNDAGFWDVAEHSAAPLHASHSNSRALCSHPRNLTDDQLRAIAGSGGVVGVHALKALVTDDDRRPTMDDFLAHLDRLIELMGEDHVAIGPDIMENYPADEYRLLWDPRLPTARLDYVYPPEFDSLASLANVTAALLARGYGESVVRKVLGENMLRLFEATWKHRPVVA
jgi:membrane dipeptidase